MAVKESNIEGLSLGLFFSLSESFIGLPLAKVFLTVMSIGQIMVSLN